MRYLYIMLALAVVSVSACKKEDDNNNNNTCTPEIVTITTDITTPTVWEDCHVYVIDVNQISVTSTLTIQPGAVVKFKDKVGDNAILVSNSGKLIAEGTGAKPIVFTSYKDDTYGGDTNGDGNASTPARRDWGGIILNNNVSSFKYCIFRYGGEGTGSSTNQPTLEFSFYYGEIDNCTFAYCGGETTLGGYGVVDARACQENGKFKITNSTFYGCIKPLFINPFLSIDNSNTFHNPANPTETNQLNGIFIEGESNEATTDVEWLENEVPIVITNSLYIGKGFNLKLGAGVIIKMGDTPNYGFHKISLHEGFSVIEGKDLAGVYFTGYRDDAHGGDTNGDGAGSLPAKGDWYGVQDFTGTLTTNNDCYSWGNILYAEYP